MRILKTIFSFYNQVLRRIRLALIDDVARTVTASVCCLIILRKLPCLPVNITILRFYNVYEIRLLVHVA